MTDLTIPKGLSKAGNTAAKTIASFFNDNDLSTGGCRPFYSPEEWRERGESYGLGSELIVVHDGGNLAPYFNSDYGSHSMIDTMLQLLSEAGVWSESCTCWYTAIYN